MVDHFSAWYEAVCIQTCDIPYSGYFLGRGGVKISWMLGFVEIRDKKVWSGQV